MGASRKRDRATHEPSPSSTGLGRSVSVPSACARCGSTAIRIIVGAEALCEEHRASWLRDEAKHIAEEQVQRVMRAIDSVTEEEIDGDWNNHLRKLATVAIEAM